MGVVHRVELGGSLRRCCMSVYVLVYRTSQKSVSTRNEVDLSSHIALWLAGSTAFVSYHFLAKVFTWFERSPFIVSMLLYS